MSNRSLLQFVQKMYHAVVPSNLRHSIYKHAPQAVRAKMDMLGKQLPTVDTFGNPLPVAIPAKDIRLPQTPVGASRFPLRVCKLCDEVDWQDEVRLKLFDALGEPQIRQERHRKGWEWAQGVYALEKMGLLHEDATGIGVGAGVEGVLFYLANQIRMVYATDIYGDGSFVDSTAYSDMLTTPEKYAKLPYRHDHLTVMHMNGLKLEFPDNHFDFAFSFSSIEHFGGHEAAAQAVREMGRVIKPGGAVVLATEVVLNGVAHDEFFSPAELEQYLIQGTGLRLIEDIDYTVSAKTLAHGVDLSRPGAYGQLPHVVLKFDGCVWTSVCLVLEKPA